MIAKVEFVDVHPPCRSIGGTSEGELWWLT